MWWRKNFSLKNFEHTSSSSTSKAKEDEQVEVFVVYGRNYMERKLKFTEFQGKRPRTDYNKESPFYRKEYLYLVDDLGNYWRSYDNCKTFIEEENGEIVR